MALFQFTALDTAGTEKRGTIEALTPQEACAAIQRYGLQPTQVFAVPPVAADFARPPMPVYPPTRPPGRGLAVAALLLSVAALLTAGAALGWQVLRGKRALDQDLPDPLGKGLDAYDFKTPRNAYRSGLEMDRARDWRAYADLEKIRRGPELEEKLRTFQVRKEEAWKGAVILFVEYEEKGVKKFTTEAFERDARTGLWLPKYVSVFMVQNDNATLANQMKSWHAKGQLN
jgi:hypothetical protein